MARLTPTSITQVCYHCGEDCLTEVVHAHDKDFCCGGCKMVYEILNESGMCDYYTISNKPGINRKEPVRENKFAFLDDEKIARSLIHFKNDTQTNIGFLSAPDTLQQLFMAARKPAQAGRKHHQQ